LAVFGYQKEEQTKDHWFEEEMMRFFGNHVVDAYDYYLKKGPLKTFTENEHHDNFFWQQIKDHPNYDDFWQERSILPHLKGIDHAVMTVGGWFDAEDLYGPLNIYKTIEKTSPKADNIIVMGPWTHGGWAGDQENQVINHIDFGDDISVWYQKNVEAPFFNHHLKCGKKSKLPEALMFDTGTKDWKEFDQWPPEEIPPVTLFFGENGELSVNTPKDASLKFDYVSDPAHPVPYRSELEGLTFTPRMFITDDQRHASKRPDVLTFETDILEESITIAGEVLADLVVSISQTDADFIIKLIDVYPINHPQYDHNPKNITMGGYQQLVRHETFRGRFRESYEHPKPFKPGKPTNVKVPLQDILHTFKKGHRMMIQIHSTWFPYIDRNPQKYVDNIFEAEASDFTKSTITVHGSSSIIAGGKAVNNTTTRP